MSIEQRLVALVMNAELNAGMIRDLTAKIDAMVDAQRTTDEHVRALARIAEIHETRLTDLEDGK